MHAFPVKGARQGEKPQGGRVSLLQPVLRRLARTRRPQRSHQRRRQLSSSPSASSAPRVQGKRSGTRPWIPARARWRSLGRADGLSGRQTRVHALPPPPPTLCKRTPVAGRPSPAERRVGEECVRNRSICGVASTEKKKTT